jgi:aspartate-semialdehyde dehydrogenase
MVVALKPVLDIAGIERIIVSTYQSVSGTGREAIDELRNQTRQVLDGQSFDFQVYDRQIAFNLIAQIDSFGLDDYTGEEWKMVHETRKIFDLPGLPVTATCVRVPVYVSHSEAVLVETKEPLTVEDARRALAAAPSVVLVDDPKTRTFSTPVDAEGSDKVFVSRVRKDTSSDRGLWMWVVSDNLRKGAATNAVQIAESLISQALL